MKRLKFKFFNDTKRTLKIHPATFLCGIEVDKSPIKPQTMREFLLPENTAPWVKLWDNSILITPEEIE